MSIRFINLVEINPDNTLLYHLYIDTSNNINGYYGGFLLMRTSNAWEDGSWGWTQTPLVEVSFLQFFARNFKPDLRNHILHIMFEHMNNNQSDYQLSNRFI